MIERYRDYFSDKKILILGFGVEGKSTYRFLRRVLPDKMLSIADSNEAIRDLEMLRLDKNVTLNLGSDYLKHLEGFDMIIKSPGISLKEFPAIDFSKFTSHTELFIRFFRNQIIGITGTKGKSTTSSLIHHIISTASRNSLLVGNIGQPPFDLIDEIDDETLIVYELSSHQLEQIRVSPSMAILLNLFQEHLDHYESFEKYQEAKFNITLFQKQEDFFIFHGDDKLITQWINKTGIERQLYPFSLTQNYVKGCNLNDENLVYHENEINDIVKVSEIMNLKGAHNLLNIMAAIDAVKLATDISANQIAESIKTFVPLEHRLEFVGKYNGIEYYNDSISTIPEATIAAVKALKTVDTLILGGFDRGIQYDDLIDFLEKSEVRNLIFIGDAGSRMLDIYRARQYSGKKIITANNLEVAVSQAKLITGNDKICLLSPAAASYGMFRNFEERGTAFKKLVKD